jgi:hypothetical protein
MDSDLFAALWLVSRQHKNLIFRTKKENVIVRYLKLRTDERDVTTGWLLWHRPVAAWQMEQHRQLEMGIKFGS